MPTTDQLYKSSIELIKRHQSSTGGFIASPNFRVYGYSWFRDGAFISDALWNVGENESAIKFDLWVADTILKRTDKINTLISRKDKGDVPSPEEHLHCRYTLTGEEVQEDWTNFQLDGFGTWLWTVRKHFQNEPPISIAHAVNLIVKYLIEFWDSPSYDWWEESPGHIHTSSIGCIAAGLEAVSDWEILEPNLRNSAAGTAREILSAIESRGIYEGRLNKWLDGNGLDASALALIEPLGLISAKSSTATKTIQAVRSTLGFPGVHRHSEDTYFGGGEWLILSAYLGLCHIARGEIAEAAEIKHWIEAQATLELELPEQIAQNLLFPEYKKPWEEKWGFSAVPLLWSHAMYIELVSKIERIQ